MQFGLRLSGAAEALAAEAALRGRGVPVVDANAERSLDVVVICSRDEQGRGQRACVCSKT